MIKSAQNIKGYLGQLFVMLQEKLQFKFTLSEQENNCWGSLIANGSYSCMFGKLQRGESNWALTGTWCYVLVLQMQLIFFFLNLLDLKQTDQGVSIFFTVSKRQFLHPATNLCILFLQGIKSCWCKSHRVTNNILNVKLSEV
jgi:hypothetical protein